MDWICKLLMAVMVVTITWQILMRYVFDSPIMWGEELSRISYAWFCFFGVALATRDEAHLKVEFFFPEVPQGRPNAYQGLFPDRDDRILSGGIDQRVRTAQRSGKYKGLHVGVAFLDIDLVRHPRIHLSAVYVVRGFFPKSRKDRRSGPTNREAITP